MMADDDRGPGRRGRVIRGSIRESSEPRFTSGSPSTPGRRHATRDFILRSPQYPAIRDRGDASASTSYGDSTTTMEERRFSEAEERAMLLEELEEVEESVELLRRRRDTAMTERERQADIERVVGDAYRDSLAVKESQVYESLEAMLKDMDDTALSALLTHGAEDSAIQALLQNLPADQTTTVKAPARSAGIEGTGSAFQIDEDENRLAEADGGDLEELLDEALRGRLRRNGELTLALDRFCGFAIDKITSYKLQSRGSSKRPMRHITIRGSFAGDLGLLVVDMDVEDGGDSKDDTPRIRTLDLEVDDPVYFAIGAERLTSFVENVNLPAILLAVRTMLPLTVERFRLLREIALRYPLLSRSQVEAWQGQGIDMGQELQGEVEVPPTTQLVNPEVIRTLRLEKEGGEAALLIHFSISFSQWGCATPQLSMEPVVKDRALPDDAKRMLKQLPERFAHLCAHNPSNARFRVALIATIDAFFGLG